MKYDLSIRVPIASELFFPSREEKKRQGIREILLAESFSFVPSVQTADTAKSTTEDSMVIEHEEEKVEEEEKSDDGLAIRTHKNRRNDDSTAHAPFLLQREGGKEEYGERVVSSRKEVGREGREEVKLFFMLHKFFLSLSLFPYLGIG